MQGRTITFPAIPLSTRGRLEKEAEKETWLDLSEKLSILFEEDPTTFSDLYWFCRWPHHKIPEPACEKLKKLGFLKESGELPRITHEVVYTAVTGNAPFWL